MKVGWEPGQKVAFQMYETWLGRCTWGIIAAVADQSRTPMRFMLKARQAMEVSLRSMLAHGTRYFRLVLFHGQQSMIKNRQQIVPCKALVRGEIQG